MLKNDSLSFDHPITISTMIYYRLKCTFDSLSFQMLRFWSPKNDKFSPLCFIPFAILVLLSNFDLFNVDISIYSEDITKNLKTKYVSKFNAKLVLDVFICIQYVQWEKEEKNCIDLDYLYKTYYYRERNTSLKQWRYEQMKAIKNKNWKNLMIFLKRI